jgi:hypothetical protein
MATTRARGQRLERPVQPAQVLGVASGFSRNPAQRRLLERDRREGLSRRAHPGVSSLRSKQAGTYRGNRMGNRKRRPRKSGAFQALISQQETLE